MNNSRSGSLGSDFSVKPVGPLFSDTQLIESLVKRILSKVLLPLKRPPFFRLTTLLTPSLSYHSEAIL